MTAMASADVRDELDCSICLSIFTDPVTLRCGHNYCRLCIDHMMDTQDESGVYSCPECRDEFPERPALMKNITLCNIVRKFLFTQPCPEAPKIFCAQCEDSPLLAVKSCLLCEASLCDDHLRVHSKAAEHVLIEPSTNLEHRKCAVHKKILEYYCTEDDTCICMSCSLVGDHRGHRVENLYEASDKKKKELRKVLKKLTRKILQVELKKSELSRQMTRLEELCTANNPVTVLQEPNACEHDSEEDGDDGGHHNTHDVHLAVISGTFHADVLPFLFSKNEHIQDQNGTFYPQEPADIKLDLKTASNQLCITGNLRIAQRTFTDQNRPWSSERFKDYQALSINSFSSGRHYWDVDTGDSLVWMVGMCYPSIGRDGIQSIVGGNNESWGLHGYRGNTKHAVRHNGKVIQVLRRITSDRFRICLDYEAGQLSFYELCDPIKHIYTFIATFTEPLHAIICVCSGTVKILG